MKGLGALVARDLKLAFRQGGGAGNALGFLLAVIVLVPFGIGPDQALLQRIAPGVLWIALLLSVLLSADRVFQADYEDGWIVLDTDLKHGERVRLISNASEGIYEVLEVREGAFRTEFAPPEGKVFVYGREVKDFRMVDYEAIAMLNVSATQEVARRLVKAEAQSAALEKQLTEQQRQLTELKAKDAARDAKLAAIEELLRANAAPAVRTAVFKNPK